MKIILTLDKNGWIGASFRDNKQVEVEFWSYSGHKEHIMHLMQKVDEYKIALTAEQKILIKQVQDSFVYPDESLIKKDLSVPASISRLQAKLQLLEIGLLDEVEDLVAQDRKVQLYWKEADNFYRTDSILLSMATTIGLTDEQLDDLFIEASKLK